MQGERAGHRQLTRVRASSRSRAPWALVAILVVAACSQQSDAVAPATVSYAPITQPRQHVQSPEVCLDGVGPAVLDEAFGRGHQRSLGVLGGFDEPIEFALPDGRQLWLLHDAFLDPELKGGPYWDRVYAQNLGMIIDATDGAHTCVSTLYIADDDGIPIAFEIGPPAPSPHSHQTSRVWYWALGGGIDSDGNLSVLWQEMIEDRSHDDVRGPQDGIVRHSLGVWLGVYDATTLDRLSFEPAPDPNPEPMYGAAVVDDPQAGFTYLFGNTLNRDLTLVGGYENGPHSATVNTLARVPLGDYHAIPQYCDGNGWVDDRNAAAAINRGGWVEWMMQPRLIDGRWLSVTKVDGWWQSGLVVQSAEQPWGPWTTVYHRVPRRVVRAPPWPRPQFADGRGLAAVQLLADHRRRLEHGRLTGGRDVAERLRLEGGVRDRRGDPVLLALRPPDRPARLTPFGRSGQARPDSLGVAVVFA
jgi:hypothetical protein